MTKAAEARLKRIRIGIGVAIGVVVVAIAGYGLLYSAGATQGEYVAGTHYRVLDDPPRMRPTDPIEVTEYFSWACVHCRTFDPLIEEWLVSQQDDVQFDRTPVAFSPDWALLAGGYRTLEAVGALELNHDRIFRAIHDTGRMFRTKEDLAAFVNGFGTTRDEFLRVFDSPEVRRQLADDDNRRREFGIQSTPTLVVARQYVIDMDVGRRQALELVDQLVARTRAERASGGS
jgi:thiol:disulfide interchange protein DsbA